MSSWRCHLCKKIINGVMSQSVPCMYVSLQKYFSHTTIVCIQYHQQNFQKDFDDPTRCDNVMRKTNGDDPTPCTQTPVASSTTADGNIDSDCQTSVGETSTFEVPLIQFPSGPLMLRSLSCRKGISIPDGRRKRIDTYVIQESTNADVSRPHNFVHVQDDWERQVNDRQDM